MSLQELFNDQLFKFPHAGCSDFPDIIKKGLSKYILLLSKVDDEYKDLINSLLDDVVNTCADINEIIRLTYAGNLIESYQVLNSVLSRMEPTLSEDLFPGDDAKYLYRARVDNGTINSTRNMFHRPFEERFDIHSSRFSISGLPCLYLSNSVFTCWSELDKPIMEKMMVSRFQSSTPLKFLNLLPNYDWYEYALAEIESGNISAEWIRATKFTMDLSLPRALKIFPLLLACYNQVYRKSSVFKPEYLFPQLLMQWLILKPNYHGIKYMSNKCTPHGGWRNKFINYAIPVKSIKPAGFCSLLSNSFKLTRPLSLEIINLTNPLFIPPVRNINDLPLADTSAISTFTLADGNYNYATSAFKLLEREIDNCSFTKLSKM